VLYSGISPLIACSHYLASWTPGSVRNSRSKKSLFTLGLSQKSKHKLELKTVRQITANTIHLIGRFVTSRRSSEIIFHMGALVSHLRLHPFTPSHTNGFSVKNLYMFRQMLAIIRRQSQTVQRKTLYAYTLCPGSVRTVFIKNTRRELFSKFHSFNSK
jgi:hypothetical protein